LPLKLPLSRISFRWQITLLGTLAAVLLLAILGAIMAALHYTKSAVMNDEKRRLREAAVELSREYLSKAQLAKENREPTPLEKPAVESSRAVLTLLSRAVLQNVEGVEGGFYSAAVDGLIGDSLPAVQVQDDQPPQNESSATLYWTILNVARSAAASNKPAEQVLAGVNDIVIVEAIPIHDGTKIPSSAWAVRRLSGLPGSNRLRAYLTVVGLGTASLACVILTLLVVGNLQGGVRKIENGLENLERDLSSQIPADADPIEIRLIARAINRLGAALNEKIESEKLIEDRLRHAERLAALGRLVAGVAHEVRNPLATIRLRVQMCQQGPESEDVRKSCEVALEEIERLNGMVNRLLSFSQTVKLHAEPVDLRRLLAERLASFQEKARLLQVKLITNFDNGSGLVRLDHDRMTQVFDNIIQNALEAMSPSGGILCVSIGSDAANGRGVREAWAEFNDTGKGISADAIQRIFDPFFTTKPSGTGLGLSICHELVRAHGGEIRVMSAEGKGTTVRVILPIREDEATARSA
jgi:signal transduction histidine kinase